MAVSIPFFATACGGGNSGGGDNVSSETAAPAAATPAGWETIQPTGLKGTFALPSPTASNAQENIQTFVGGQGTKQEIYVTVIARGGTQIGKDEADELAIFEKQRLTMQNNRLQGKGFKPEIKYEKDLPVENGLGQQIKTDLGKQYIFNQFYVTPEAFYHVKIDNADESNATVQQFINSFQP